MFCGEVEVVRVGNPHLLKSWGGCFVEKWKPCGLATRTCLRAEGGGFVEKWKPCGLATRIASELGGWCFLWSLRAWGGGVFCGKVEAVRAGNPHLLKSWRRWCFVEKWKPCGLATRTCLRAGGVVLWRSGGRAGWQPALLKGGGGGCFVEKWKLCGLATRTCLRAGRVVFCGA